MSHHFLKFMLASFVTTLVATGVTAQKETLLFETAEKAEWYIYNARSGKDNDTQNVFRFEGNTIHVSGQDFGYIATKKKFRDFRLTLEFKWGEKKYPPRENAKR